MKLISKLNVLVETQLRMLSNITKGALNGTRAPVSRSFANLISARPLLPA